MSEQINVESIMKEIKKEIEVKGYTNDLLSFDDVVVDVGAMNVNKFDKIKFNEDIYVANHEWEVNPYRPLQGNKVTVFFKKVIRKLVYFNASIVRMMNQMNCYIEEKDKEIAELKKEIEQLKSEK